MTHDEERNSAKPAVAPPEMQMDAATPSDEMLLHAIAQHEVNALEVFYERHAQVVYNLIMRIVREPAVADEVLQETFWHVWQKAGDFRGEGAGAAWLFRIARNHSLDQLRRQKARPQPAVMLMDELPRAAASATPHNRVESGAERDLIHEQVHRVLSDLPVEQRQCLELAYFEGMSQREISDYIHTPVGTVKTRIRLGLEKLERGLYAAGMRAEDFES
ncbi:MAG: sigma-70 family RNA polymerase sigma factor [Anaerolineae bacterium]|nr:sigma-70 family RNA polymerase sigma factor [Anaerolineae bacterium]MCI0610850.1 sigma-70 family RNA polymerase sigma factor [Anaerolineae bacterium]